MKRSKSPKAEKSLYETISYFSFFGYAPEFRQIFAYFPEKISRSSLSALITAQMRRGKVARYLFPPPKTASDAVLASKMATEPEKNSYLYTLPQYGMHTRNRAVRRAITQKKLQAVSGYLNALSRLPIIRFAGLSGSAAMENCRPGADVDIFIVTAPHLLFTGRFLSILLAALYGVRTPRGGICLNLFFGEADLTVPPAKRSLYTAHEVLQMKPLFDKGNISSRFLAANGWVRGYLPNTVIPKAVAAPAAPAWLKLLLPVEALLKRVELRIIRKNRTGHLITPAQLWLFRQDFSRKVVSLFPESNLL